MGNALEAPVTEKDTVRFERDGRALKAQQHGGLGDRKDKDTIWIIPGDECSDGIAAAACSMQGWRCSMEDRLCARMDLEGCPLGVQHIFCLFDGHGGDSVAEYCRTYLADRIVQRIREAQALATTSATKIEAATIAQSAQARVPANGAGKAGINEHPGGRGGGRTFGDGERGSDGGTATAAPYMVAGCVRDACREVDAEVKGTFFTPAGRYVAPRVDDPLDVTPKQQPPRASSSSGGFGEGVDQGRPMSMEERLEKAKRKPSTQADKSPARDGDAGATKESSGETNAGFTGGRGDGSGNATDDTDGDPTGFSTCGTTSLIVVVSDAFIICCNTGDSRAVLASEGASRQLSVDHKPDNRAERQRIEAAGGKVEHNRVEGKLAVSRCIGDHPFKSDPNIPLERQMVVCDPEVTVIKRSDEDEFVVMACDGVWDVMGNDEACFFLRKCIQEGNRDLGRILEDMEDVCLAKQSMDNMSVLVIAFKAAWEEGLHLHKSARYILQWGCEEVSRWLSTNNFGQYQDDFDKHYIDGVQLLSLTEADLHHKLRLKKVGLRKRLWQKLSPLRSGYLAWSKVELAAWLDHVGLRDFQRAVVEKDIDGRVLSTMTKAEMRSLARNAGLHKGSRRRLYSVIDDLKAGGADGEWVALHGSMLVGARYSGDGNGGDPTGDAWLRSPYPGPSGHDASSTSSSSSCSSHGDCDGAYEGEGREGNGSGPKRADRGRHQHRHDRHSQGQHRHPSGGGEGMVVDPQGGGINRGEEAPVVVGQSAVPRKGSGMFTLDGARRLSRALRRQSRPQAIPAPDRDEERGGNALQGSSSDPAQASVQALPGV
ncbi:unnamed protein product [Ectocarpus sp. 12 AP-2014]